MHDRAVEIKIVFEILVGAHPKRGVTWKPLLDVLLKRLTS